MGAPLTKPGLYTGAMGTSNANRMTMTMERDSNPEYVFTGNANEVYKPRYYVSIFNVGDAEHKIERPWVSYNPAQRGKMIVIPPCPKDKTYSTPFRISDVVQMPKYIITTGEMLTQGVDGKFLAQDALNPEDPHGNWRTVRAINAGAAMNEGTNLYHWGVFWTVNDIPSEEELKGAKERQETYYNRLVEDAKALYMAGNQGRQQIGPTHRRAASYFGLSFEWNQLYTRKEECPGCGQPINPGMVRHFVNMGGCGSVINWEKALAVGAATVQEAIAAGIIEPQAEEMAKKHKKGE